MASTSQTHVTCPICRALNSACQPACSNCSSLLIAPGVVLAEPPPPEAYVEKRTAIRHPVYEPGAVVDAEGREVHPVAIRNISTGGLLFDCGFPYYLNDRVKMRFTLRDRGFVADVIVRHTARWVSDEALYAVGAEFVNVDAALASLVAQCEGIPSN